MFVEIFIGYIRLFVTMTITSRVTTHVPVIIETYIVIYIGLHVTISVTINVTSCITIRTLMFHCIILNTKLALLALQAVTMRDNAGTEFPTGFRDSLYIMYSTTVNTTPKSTLTRSLKTYTSRLTLVLHS